MTPTDPPPACITDYEARAQERMSEVAWAYVSGAAADEITLRDNCSAFERIRLAQRVLVGVSRLSTATRLLGADLPAPLLLAPTAAQCMTHPEGEMATVRGAAPSGTPLVVSTFSNTAVEDIAKEAVGPLWFQLYIQPDRGFTKSLVQRAEAAGCSALVVTVDTPVLGTRNREDRVGFQLSEGLRFVHFEDLDPAAAHDASEAGSIYAPILDASLTWKDIDWIRSIANVPVVLKGITTPGDASIAVREAVDGIVVSNHGARNLDTTPATIEALPRVVERVAGALPVLMDGGIRRGTDILKALALGADAVLVGRPYLYGLAVGGAGGVERVIGLLLRELAMAMALTGCNAIGDVDRCVLWEA